MRSGSVGRDRKEAVEGKFVTVCGKNVNIPCGVPMRCIEVSKKDFMVKPKTNATKREGERNEVIPK